MATTVAGVYVIFGSGRRVYIGESGQIFGRGRTMARHSVAFARTMGLDWTILRYMPGSARRARLQAEAEVTDAYRKAGFEVVSIDMPEHVRRMHARIDPVSRSAKIRRAWNDNPKRRIAQAERLRNIAARRTPEERSQAAAKGWGTRRANPIPRGTSRRTQTRNRAAQAGRVSQ